MAKRQIRAIEDDFSEVISFLKERHIVTARPSPDVIATAKEIHGNTYSLILWKFRLRNLPEHARVFVEEIASDSLQILPQVLMGYSKTAKLLIRGVAENALRHVYFSDHPIEFIRMNREKKWFLTIEELCVYAKNHPSFMEVEERFDAVNQLKSIHSELSAGVHGRTVSDLEMRVALRRIEYEADAARANAELLKKSTQAINFILAIFHREKVRSFQTEDRRIVLRTMPERARTIWNDHDV